MKKVTLDHNCIIESNRLTPRGEQMRAILNSKKHQFFVANIGASEYLPGKKTPMNYHEFEAALQTYGLAHLPRLNPIALMGVCFFEHCVMASDEMIALSNEIEQALFPKPLRPSDPGPGQRAIHNRLCDVHTMWCHIHYENDIFLTMDENFLKKEKKEKLINLGAKEIVEPSDFN